MSAAAGTLVLRAEALDRFVETGSLPGGIDVDGASVSTIRSVLARPSARLSLRTDSSGAVVVHRGWVSPDGLVIVREGHTISDAPYELWLAGGADAVARTIAGLIDLGPVRAGTPSDPVEGLSWDDVLAPVSTGRAMGWAATWAGHGAGVLPRCRLHHLRVTTRPAEQATTWLLLVDVGAAGYGVAEPADDGSYRLVPQRPSALWRVLTALDRALAAAR